MILKDLSKHNEDHPKPQGMEDEVSPNKRKTLEAEAQEDKKIKEEQDSALK